MEQPNEDLSKYLIPEKTWFFERGDGFRFACNESEAHEILRNRTNWMRRDFKMLGVSDGKTYKQVKKEEKEKLVALKEEVKALSVEIGRYLRTLERLKFDELLGEADEKVIKCNNIIEGLEKKLDEKNNILKDARKVIETKAFEAEFEKAKGHIEMPTNQDVITPDGKDRDKILRALNK